MKACKRCGEEVAIKDGESYCEDCEKKRRLSRKRSLRRKLMNEVYRDHGMVRVRGNRGGTYWE